MRFSIIVPVYNKENYISRCLNSVVNQTYKDFECILVNDGSTDKSADICVDYSEKYPFFRVLNKTNGGLSDARNFGIDAAQGEYLLFLDSDDLIHPQTLEICDKIIAKKSSDIIAFGIKAVTASLSFEKQLEHIDEINENQDIDLVENLFYRDIGWSVCNKAYKKDVFENVRFPKGRLFEDQFVLLKLLKGRNITVISNDLYFYYQDTADSLSKRKVYDETYDYILASLEVLKDVGDSERYLPLAANLVFKRMVLLLTNVFYQEGQFRNCDIQKINKIVWDNYELILNGLSGNEKRMFSFYRKAPNFVKNLLIRMRFDPNAYVKSKIKRGER